MRRHQFRRHRPLFARPEVKAVKEKKRKWVILPILWAGLKRTCMVFGALVLFSALMSGIAALRLSQITTLTLPDEFVLFLQFEKGLVEKPEQAGLSDTFAAPQLTVHDVIWTLDRAKDDPRVKGLYVRLQSGQFGLTNVQEFRAALKRFRAAGKFAYIYASSYGEAGGFGGYYMASAFDQIWMQPLGIVSISGLNAEVPYFRKLLNDIGVLPEFIQRKDYKTAYESATRQEMSEENREMLEQMIGDIRAQLLSDIAYDRELDIKTLEQLVDQGLFTSEDAYEAGLITTVGYADMIVNNIAEMLRGDPEDYEKLFINLGLYKNDLASRSDHVSHGMVPGIEKTISSHDFYKPKVALVHVVGAIMPSDLNASSYVFAGGQVAAADDIAAAISEVRRDDEIEAIVVRIDSPGGSPTASERILRALIKAQEIGKPVIVSMGATAASGGYWIASHADRIYAMPTTLTGSIGVVGGKFVLRDLWENIGVNWERVQWGDNAGIWSINTPFDAKEKERIETMLDQVYDSFITRVAEGRNLHRDLVEPIAQGKVWTGVRAVQNGLVDELGGLDEALDYTAGIVGAESREGIEIILMPRPKTALEQLAELLANQGSVYEGMKVQAAFMTLLKPYMQKLAVQQNPELFMTYQEPLLPQH